MHKSILIATQCFPPDVGGIETLVGDLSIAMAAQDHRVTVLADAAKRTEADPAAVGAVTVTRFGGPKFLRRRMKAASVHRHLRTQTFTGLICDSWKSLELIDPGDVPVVVLAHGMEFPPEASSRRQRRMRQALGKARTVVASSQYAAARVAHLVPAFVPIVVINPPIHPQPEPSAAALRDLSVRVGARAPLIAGLGRLEPRKGFDKVIAALPQLTAQFPDVTFALAGAGDDRDRLVALAAEHDVANHVAFLGRIDDATKAALLAKADVFAMPTRRVGASVEGFGIVYAEAAWYGTPAIAGRDGGAVDAVQNGAAGLVVDGERTDDVADALVRLLADEDMSARLGLAAQTHVQTMGTWERCLPRYLDALERQA
ncbi:MAG: glycosyltransferase family 4 protein [Pseudomonadota bacterium]